MQRTAQGGRTARDGVGANRTQATGEAPWMRAGHRADGGSGSARPDFAAVPASAGAERRVVARGGAGQWHRERTIGWVRGIGETLGIIGLFVGLGLGAGWIAGRAGGVAAPYAPAVMTPVSDETVPAASPDEAAPEPLAPRRWLVDGFNVLHAGVLQGRDRRNWWTAAVQARLIAIVATFDDTAAELWVVFDDARSGAGARCSVPAEASRVRVAHAPSADDWIVREVRTASAPGAIAVVTADRQVRDRCRHRGAQVVSPLVFLARCDRSANARDA